MDKAESISIKHIKAGDVAAFEGLFNAHYPVLCFYAKKITGDLDQARDIVQGIFVSLYENRAKLQITTSINSYLYKSTYNACLNHLKQRGLHHSHHEVIKRYAPEGDDSDTMIVSELEEKIQGVIATLPERCREVFVMNRFEGKKNKEIAKQLGISIRTVETQISKALKILRENLTDFLPVLLFWVLF